MSPSRAGARLWLALDRLSGLVGLERAWFRASCLVASRLLGSPVVHMRFAASRVDLFRRFLRETGLETTHPLEETVVQHLLEATLIRWRYLHATDELRAAALARDVVMENESLLDQALRSGRGVLFVMSHHGLSEAFIEVMRHRGHEGRAVRRVVKKRLREAGREPTDLARSLMGAQDLLEAQRALAAGGIAYILPDGRYGRSGVRLPLYGRSHDIMTGFAELALSSGALVVPVATVADRDGTLRITFHDPFDPGPAEAGRQERTERLAGQYAVFLSRCWASSPGSVKVARVARFLEEGPGRVADAGEVTVPGDPA